MLSDLCALTAPCSIVTKSYAHQLMFANMQHGVNIGILLLITQLSYPFAPPNCYKIVSDQVIVTPGA